MSDARAEHTSMDAFATTTRKVGDAIYTVFQHAPNTLGDFYLQAVERHSDETFFVYDQERYLFRSFWELTQQTACALIEAGVSRGDRVGIAMRNYPEWALSFMAATSIGAIAVCFNSWWSSEELEFGVRDSGVKLLFVDEERLQRVIPWIKDRQTTLVNVRCAPARGSIEWSDFIASARSDTARIASGAVDSEDPAIILYTSGSTSTPKGVVSSHRALIHAVMGYEFGSALAAQKKKASSATDGSRPQFPPALLLTAPLFHITGLNSQLLLSLRLGRKLVAMRKWDAEQALALIERERITHFSGVPTMVYELMQSPSYARYDVSSLEAITGGGSAMTEAHTDKIVKGSGGRIAARTGYAMTETNGIAASHGGKSMLRRPASVGRAQPPLVSLKIVDADGNCVAPNTEGEILIHGAMNFSSYWNKPEETQRTLRKGWVHTGDLGYLDAEGFLYLTGRLKDMVIRGGENISCFEVESAIRQHEAIFECVVFGVPDERLGERVACACELHPNASLDASELKSYLASKLAAYKIPEHIYFQTLPRLASGKVDRRAVKASVHRPPASVQPDTEDGRPHGN